MQYKRVIYALSFIIFSGLLVACGGATSTSTVGQVGTSVTATLQVMTSQSPVTTDKINSTLLPTAESTQVMAQGSFIPYAAGQCEQIRSDIEKAVGAPMVIETTSFNDRMTGGTGTACRVHASGNETTLSMKAFEPVDALLRWQGWSWDSNYGTVGATRLMEGFRKGGALGLLTVSWKPLADDLCPSDKPIDACELPPEQKLVELTYDIAQVVVYVPLSAEQCTALLMSLQFLFPVTLVQETVNFHDLEGNIGTACQVQAAGNGLDFSDVWETANALDSVLISLGWWVSKGVDGPTGTVREYSNGNQTAITTVMWEPSAEANCSNDQPIESCSLTPVQQLYTVTVAFAQK